MNTLKFLLPFSEIILMVSASLLVISLSYYIFRKNNKKGLRILIIFSLTLLYFLYCEKLDNIYSAPSYTSTFSQLNTETKWPLRMTMIEAEDGQYVEAVIFPGKLPSLVRLSSFRSGMPAYVFDLNGKLVDSTIDHHDDDRYQARWEKSKHRNGITETEFIEIISEMRK